MDDEYELLSHDEVERLKREAERYKHNPFVKAGEDEKLYNSIVKLTDALNRMASVFENVKKEVLDDYENTGGPDEKLNSLLEQNRHIAEALVSLNEKLSSFDKDSESQGFYDSDVSVSNEEEKGVLDEEKKVAPSKQEEPVTDNASDGLDFLSWNYGDHSKPGVSFTDSSGSKPSPNEEESPPSPDFNVRSTQQDSANQAGGMPSTGGGAQGESFKSGFGSDDKKSFSGEKEDFFKQGFNKGAEGLGESEDTQFRSSPDTPFPKLKPIDNKKPVKKKKFGLF